MKIYTLMPLVLLILLSSCGSAEQTTAQVRKGRGAGGPTPVDVAVAKVGSLAQIQEYTATTQPFQEVALRAQVEGQLLSLNVDQGDPVTKGQILARLDDSLLESGLRQAEAERAARGAEVAQAQAQVSNIRTQVEQARLELQQAQADAQRLDQLAKQGAISIQEAELAQTSARTAEQALRSTQAQVRSQLKALSASESRITAQQALLAQARERRSYALLKAPLTGVVLSKSSEVGNLVRIGDEVLRLGDLRQIKIPVQISELELSQIRVGQTAQVRLDAFGTQEFLGKVTRIAPAADPVARLVPVEVVIANPQGRIASGLLARVQFTNPQIQRVLLPVGAIQDPEAKPSIYVIKRGEGVTVQTRPVQLGTQADGKVEILSGLQPGEEYVARSGKPLKPGETVRLSLLSEGSKPQRGGS